jgi:hypothetical protein
VLRDKPEQAAVALRHRTRTFTDADINAIESDASTAARVRAVSIRTARIFTIHA